MIELRTPALEEAKQPRGVNERTEKPAFGNETRETVLRLSGLDCADCAAKLARRIQGTKGITKAEVNFGASRLTVDHSAPLETIVRIVEQAGYRVEPDRNHDRVSISEPRLNPRVMLTILSGIALGLGFAATVAGTTDSVTASLFALAILAGGYMIVRGAWQSLRVFTLDMNVLMTVAVIGAILLGEWAEGATVVFLFAVGNALQAHTIGRTRRSIRNLMDMSPKEAVVKRAGQTFTLPVEQLVVGDIILVRPGDRIPMDGVVVAGRSSVNQAPITGESLPVAKYPGGTVYAGTLNERGSLEVRVTKLAADTTLARIIHMVEEAQAQKAPAQHFVDVFARYYTPVVILAALGIAALPPLLLGLEFAEWFYRALILLVIACPCALVISTPVAIVSAIGNAARNGVLIKGGAQLEALAKVRAVALDKTGTVTIGRPAVTDVITATNITGAEAVRLAVSVEALSEHPLGESIVRYAVESGIAPLECTEFESLTGEGAQASVGGQTYYIGSPRLFRRLGVDQTPFSTDLGRLQGEGKTVVVLGTRNRVLALIAIADQTRAGSSSVMKALRQEGIRELVLLTGDNQATARTVGSALGIGNVKAELLPGQKLDAIKRLRQEYGSVAMVGEGVNDAPALAAADVGIAMGAAGTDTALETADIALMNDDLAKLPYTLRLSRRTLRIIKENIIFAITVKAVFILLTVLGLSTLWMAVFADTGAALIVIANSMRLLGGQHTKARGPSPGLARAA